VTGAAGHGEIRPANNMSEGRWFPKGHEEECASVDATAVGTCLRLVLLRGRGDEARPTSLECYGPLHDTNTRHHKIRSRQILGGVRRGDALEGVEFR
jgi:hypothetical protein